MRGTCSSSSTVGVRSKWPDGDDPMTPSTSDPNLPPLGVFDYQPRTRLVFGVGAVECVGELARELPAKKILLVTDRGIAVAGHAERVRRALEAAGLAVAFYDQVEENPSTRCVEKCVSFARDAAIDAIVGLGGGSSLDTAKGCNFLLTNGGRMQDYWGVGKAKLPMLPLIAIPTTGAPAANANPSPSSPTKPPTRRWPAVIPRPLLVLPFSIRC